MEQGADIKSLSELKKTPGRLMKRRFFEAPVEMVAPRLLGKALARRTRFGWLTGRIVEVEAYLGPHHETPDRAAHSHRGPTPRNRVMFGPAGHAYVYSIYGMYYCMNITCEKEGQAGCILLRALEPLAGLEQMARNRGLDLPATLLAPRNAPEKNGAASQQGWRSLRALTSGPSRLCQALQLTRGEYNGLDLLDPASPLQVWDDGVSIRQALVTPRIGIRHAADLPLRFSIPAHPCVSGSKRTPGKCIFLRSVSVSTMKRSSSRSSPRTKLQT
jgi:DNA-3-methyladenine glycosylase